MRARNKSGTVTYIVETGAVGSDKMAHFRQYYDRGAPKAVDNV